MRHWIFALLFGFYIGVGHAQETKPVKIWTFSLEHGSLLIELKSSPGGLSSLGIRPNGQIPEAPLSEHVEPLREVLAEMPRLGLDPHKLFYVNTRIFTEDVLDKLAYECVDSQAWRLSLRNNGEGKERIMISLLNQSKIYEPYNEVFKDYGIQVTVTSVEEVGLMRFSYVPLRNVRDHANAHQLVPADATIGMHFSPFDPNLDSTR